MWEQSLLQIILSCWKISCTRAGNIYIYINWTNAVDIMILSNKTQSWCFIFATFAN